MQHQKAADFGCLRIFARQLNSWDPITFPRFRCLASPISWKYSLPGTWDREAMFQISSMIGRYVFPNSFPFALNVSPGRSSHFSNSRGLFFRCSNAEATTSACGVSGSATTTEFEMDCR